MKEFELYLSLTNLPHEWLWPLLFLMISVLLMFAWQLRQFLISRILVFMAFGILLAQPYMTHYTLAPTQPVALVILDQSPSMQLRDRSLQSHQVWSWLQSQLSEFSELQIERYDLAAKSEESTALFAELSPLMKKYDAERLSAIFLITDGQITDVPDAHLWPKNGPPLHVLLVGRPDEQQAYLELSDLPPFGMVGTDAIIRLRANWRSYQDQHKETVLTVRSDHAAWQKKIPLNEWTSLALPLRHAGTHQYILSLPQFDHAVLPATQTAVVNVQAIQGKMKILLQSRKNELPEILRSIADDPMIDLTINTSQQNNFSDYDMVILDEVLTDKVPDVEWQNSLAKFMRGGGAVFMLQSHAPVRQIAPALLEALPVTWQEVQSEESAVQLTPHAAAHPILAGSLENNADMTLSSFAAAKRDGDAHVLLENNAHAVLLAVSQLDQGRMALIANPEILTGSDGNALQRQIFYWLTENPDLSDRAITANIQDNIANVEYLSSEAVIGTLRVTRPDRSAFELPLTAQGNGLHSGTFIPDQKGVYVISDGTQDTPLINGNVMTQEWQMATATSAKLAPLARATDGQVIWLEKNAQPALRWTTIPQGGMHDWLPLRESRAMVRTGAVTCPAIPKSILLIFIAAALSYAWWRESQ